MKPEDADMEEADVESMINSAVAKALNAKVPGNAKKVSISATTTKETPSAKDQTVTIQSILRAARNGKRATE